PGRRGGRARRVRRGVRGGPRLAGGVIARAVRARCRLSRASLRLPDPAGLARGYGRALPSKGARNDRWHAAVGAKGRAHERSDTDACARVARRSRAARAIRACTRARAQAHALAHQPLLDADLPEKRLLVEDRKSTRLNSSHGSISYAVFR